MIAKKNFLFIILILFTLIFMLLIYLYQIPDKNIIMNDTDDNKSVVQSNALTMMYETEAGSGEYQVTSDTTWPQDGYIFNEELSACENGSELTWDDENKRVIVSTSVSDK